MQRPLRLIYAGLLLLVAACASTPQATRERDREAKNFEPQPATSTIYVFRPDFPDPEEDTVLWVDGRLIGSTLPQTYFRIHLNPGLHFFNGVAGDDGAIRLETRPGEIYFIRLQAVAGRSVFEHVDAATGRRELTNCCYLLENWRPGQRPLLR
ncbi:MAG: DUF2846 domain-containing protein [Betaproteobacteria bacterium]|nr:DUF2846 domain-containing protein [Betaproteobacteria bacterium]